MKKTTCTCKKNSNSEGGALVSVVTMMVPMMIVLGTLTAASLQQAHTMHLESRRMRAIAIAEAGMNLAFGLIESNPAVVDTAGTILHDNDFSGGSFEVTAELMNDGVIALTSNASYRERHVTVKATAALATSSPNGDGEPNVASIPPGPFGPFGLLAGSQLSMSGGMKVDIGQYGAHSNGSLNISGGANFTGLYVSSVGGIVLSGGIKVDLDDGAGTMHANDSILLSGGHIDAAEITSSESVIGNWGVDTDALNISPVVTWPDWHSRDPEDNLIRDVDLVDSVAMPPLDIDAYREYAIQNGYFYEDAQDPNFSMDLTRQWLTDDIERRTGQRPHPPNSQTDIIPDGGVFFVDGDVTLGQDMNMYGMIIATGDITLGGASNLENTTDFPALVSIDGDITIGGGNNGPKVNGWVYAMNGNVTAGGGATGLTGIIAAQELTISAGFKLETAIDDHWAYSPWPGDGGAPGSGGGGSGAPSHSGGQVRLLSWYR